MGLAFIDIETTGLDPEHHEIWEIALIVDDEQYAWVLDVDLSKADSGALRVGRFYERMMEQHERRHEDLLTNRNHPGTVAMQVATLTANRQLVGANPAFDAAFLSRFLANRGYTPAWHYHVIDVKAFAAGWLFCVAPELEMPPPWSTEALADRLGVDASGFERHTALGDAGLAKAMYEAVTS